MRQQERRHRQAKPAAFDEKDGFGADNGIQATSSVVYFRREIKAEFPVPVIEQHRREHTRKSLLVFQRFPAPTEFKLFDVQGPGRI